MANTKISALPAASTPLAGTEVLPVVQGGITEQVAVNDLTVRNVRANATTGILQVTGPAAASTRVMTVPDANFTSARTDAAQSFTGDQTLSTGNLIQGTAGKGFNFTANANAAGMTSELLNWYEEGTFTPTLIGTTTNPTVTYGLQRGRYTRIGRLVTLEVYVTWTAFSGGSGNVAVGSFPFTIDGATGAYGGGAVSLLNGFTLSAGRTSVGLQPQPGTIYATPTCFGSAVTTQSIAVGSVAASGGIMFTLTYSV
jgi:hypothetical protein